MSTTVPDAPTIDAVEVAYRWLDAIKPATAQVPQPLLELFFTAMTEQDALPEVAAIAGTLGCPEAEAEAWGAWLEAHLIHPGHYAPLFAAEDALAERRTQWQNYQQDVSTTAARLAELSRRLRGRKPTRCWARPGRRGQSALEALEPGTRRPAPASAGFSRRGGRLSSLPWRRHARSSPRHSRTSLARTGACGGGGSAVAGGGLGAAAARAGAAGPGQALRWCLARLGEQPSSRARQWPRGRGAGTGRA